MASYTPSVKEILRAHGCHFERPGKGDHEIWYSPITQRRFPVDAKILSRHRQRGAETSWYREAILICPYLQQSCVSIAKNAIRKIRRLAMHPSSVPSVDGAAHSVHIVLWVKRLLVRVDPVLGR